MGTQEQFTTRAASTGTTLVQVERVSRIIGNNGQKTTILDDLTFSIPERSLFAINGPSGSGKSTLLNLLTGIDRPTSGIIRFAETELWGRREDELARWRGKHIGIVFQFFQLIPTLTALENVLLALELGGTIPRRQWRERAMTCLSMALATEVADRLPTQISGGQQQRVAIARALANNPPVIVADEPTGNLDSKTAHQIFDILAELPSQGKTVIYVTHDPHLAERASAQIALLDGRIVAARGTTALPASEVL